MIELTEKIKDISENGLKRLVDTLFIEQEIEENCTSLFFIEQNYGVFVHMPSEPDLTDYSVTILGDLQKERKDVITRYCESNKKGAIILVDGGKLIVIKVDDLNRKKIKHVIKDQFFDQVDSYSDPVLNCKQGDSTTIPPKERSFDLEWNYN